MVAAPAWGSTSATNATTPAINAGVPAGVTPGDIVVAMIAILGTASIVPVTPPDATWKQNGATVLNAAASMQSSLFWKRATAADTGSYAFTSTGSGLATTNDVMRYTGCVPAGDPFDGINSAATTGLVSTTPPVALTITGANRRLVWIGLCATAGAAANLTPPPAYTGLEWAGSRSKVYDTTQAPAGPTGPVSGTTSQAGGDGFICWLYALRAADPAGGQFFNFL